MNDQFLLRLPDGMRERIAASAEANNRSMNAEIVARLEASLATEPHAPDEASSLAFAAVVAYTAIKAGNALADLLPQSKRANNANVDILRTSSEFVLNSSHNLTRIQLEVGAQKYAVFLDQLKRGLIK